MVRSTGLNRASELIEESDGGELWWMVGAARDIPLCIISRNAPGLSLQLKNRLLRIFAYELHARIRVHIRYHTFHYFKNQRIY
jgi:hypothetical protein